MPTLTEGGTIAGAPETSWVDPRDPLTIHWAVGRGHDRYGPTIPLRVAWSFAFESLAEKTWPG